MQACFNTIVRSSTGVTSTNEGWSLLPEDGDHRCGPTSNRCSQPHSSPPRKPWRPAWSLASGSHSRWTPPLPPLPTLPYIKGAAGCGTHHLPEGFPLALSHKLHIGLATAKSQAGWVFPSQPALQQPATQWGPKSASLDGWGKEDWQGPPPLNHPLAPGGLGAGIGKKPGHVHTPVDHDPVLLGCRYTVTLGDH